MGSPVSTAKGGRGRFTVCGNTNTNTMRLQNTTNNMSFFSSKSGGTHTKQGQLHNRREVQKMFAKADKDGDGKLTPQEWHRVLNSSGCQTSMADVEEFFREMDRDHDGKLSFGEFMGEETPLVKVFKKMDKDGDGSISKEEYLNLCKNLSKAQAEEAFSRFDSSGDNNLDFKEFCQMIHQRQEEQKK